jgi:hypothetical protein
LYVTDRGTGVGNLNSYFRYVGSPNIEFPNRPENPDLVDFIDELTSGNCLRIPTFGSGASEENTCKSSDGSDSGFFTHYTDGASFRSIRSVYLEAADADIFGTKARWADGMSALYHDDDGSAVLYLDDTSCRCTLVAYGGTDEDALLDSWL